MCLTTEALLIFLNLLPPEIVEVSADRIVVRAETRAAIWKRTADQWCTAAPQVDASFRNQTGDAV